MINVCQKIFIIFSFQTFGNHKNIMEFCYKTKMFKKQDFQEKTKWTSHFYTFFGNAKIFVSIFSVNLRNGWSIFGTTFHASKPESENNIYCQHTVKYKRSFLIHSIFWSINRVSSMLKKITFQLTLWGFPSGLANV